MKDAFLAGKANFAGVDGRSDRLFLGGVIHKAFVDVNEEGTEAAAATAIGMMAGIPPKPPEFRADHPFLFLIQDNRTAVSCSWVASSIPRRPENRLRRFTKSHPKAQKIGSWFLDM